MEILTVLINPPAAMAMNSKEVNPMKYLIINSKTGENMIREFTPAQLSEVVRDGFDYIIPMKKG